MLYYKLAILNTPLEPLTYEFEEHLQVGEVVEITIGNRKKIVNGVILAQVEKPEFNTKSILNRTNKIYKDEILKIGKFISEYYVCSIGEALDIFLPNNTFVENSTQPYICDTKIKLSLAQQNAYNFIVENKVSLLFGDTGSGKTEIYIKLIELILSLGKEVVLLMPEISLTPQMEKRLKSVFGDIVAIWHSKVTKTKKEKILKGLEEKSIKVVAGARSSLFLPFNNLGLIIVDEEHDESYKSDSKPRLNVKDLSVYIGNKFDIKVVLGSATPSLSSYVKVPHFRLNETYHISSKNIKYDDSENFLNDNIIQAIDKNNQNKSQSIIFLPTRANFKYQICSSCGKAVECPFCSVSMSLHKNDKALKCHYCGYSEKIPEFCPSCKTGIVSNLRVGTAEIQTNLKTVFTNSVIEKFDRDSIKNDTNLRAILKDFNDEKIDILVGTQMLSKGHDYHNVKLCIIIGIDSVLNMNSYRSRERALSLVVQLAGRSGRNGFGEVIIQTKNSDFFQEYINDYQKFLDEELEFRKELYPPFKKLAKVVFAHTNGLKAKEELEYFVNKVQNFDEVELIGYGEAGIFKIASKYRYEMLIRSSSATKLLKFLHSVNSNIAIIDMDCNI